MQQNNHLFMNLSSLTIHKNEHTSYQMWTESQIQSQILLSLGFKSQHEWPYLLSLTNLSLESFITPCLHRTRHGATD